MHAPVDQHHGKRPEGLRAERTRPRHVLRDRRSLPPPVEAHQGHRGPVHPPAQLPGVLGVREEGTSYRVFSALLVNGLFQTEDYARAILTNTDGANSTEFTAKRMDRQAVLTRDNPPHAWLVLDETVLRRNVGSPDIMREQLNYLLTASERINTMIQVIPSSTGYHAGLGGSFTILSFDEEADLAYTESAGEGLLIEKPARIKHKVVTWDLIRGYALPIEESRALIRKVMEEL
ncbi:DUF5753 domain-containing protein [Actinomadura sp. 3N508]|uniref:DUF5753 domain-containing protein n=1 Tax=Actinomadura sp. 3N508 TaxID=3375153 RepID=UPI0037B4ED62